jgi:ubiquinone/menaquinone biosynthesis C-methylase UbiE
MTRLPLWVDCHLLTADRTDIWVSSDIAQRWRDGAERRARILGPATERMLDAAGLRAGQRVLDLAAGTGDQTVLAAQRVTPGGSVLAVDISATMLEEASRAARAGGLSNVETLIADGSQLTLEPQSFDVAISRLGLMFMDDLQAALTAVRQSLKPGAKFAALVWSSPERNPWMGIVIDVVRQAGRMPAHTPGVVRALSLGQPGLLLQALTQAKFAHVHVEAVSAPRELESLDEAYELLTSSAATGSAELIGNLQGDERERLVRQIVERFAAYRRADGSVTVPGELWLGVGDCYDQAR